VVGPLQREPEIIHGENIFQKVRRLEVADTPGLANGIEAMRERVGALVKVVVVLGFVDAHSPQGQCWDDSNHAGSYD